ncbi:MAG: NAD(P)(+) transhydrogenase (Re/Si-specific) subunit beta [Nitrococcus sp.]|nr:NAD(P)(+) transhydrogenase (Re/Si-specific) subunit beta [Nitrococcus sp.]
MSTVIELCYFAAAVLFILGLKGMSSPRTARKGIVWAGIGMVIATLATFFHPDIQHAVNYLLIIIAIAISGVLAWWSGKRVPMTDMPQMVALYNGMGGGAAAAIGAVELLKAVSRIETDLPIQAPRLVESHGYVGAVLGADHAALGITGALIGTVAFSGSLVAWAKLDGRLHRNRLLPAQQLINLGVFAAAVLFGILSYYTDGLAVIIIFFALALVFGVFMAVPIGGADMPVVISLFNALTGLAVGFEGYLLGNPAMIIAGTVVGAAGTLLTQLMAKAMNRPLTNVLFSGFGTAAVSEGSGPEGEMKAIQAEDAAIMMGYANQVIIAPGYGMAVAQAQHKVWELAELLQERDIPVKFAIHPVAGRMPGHMNVLLAEAGVPYDLIHDMEEINAEFNRTDVVVVIGANDVVNPAAKDDPASPIYGMPILNVADANNVIVIKRGKGKGFSGVENHLFFAENCHMLFNDGQKAAGELIQVLKRL